jgi:hypothetical protein
MILFLEHYGVVYTVAALCLLEILVKGILHGMYRRLIKAAQNMGQTNHKLMKMIRNKFAANYELRLGIENVDVFVDKYMRNYRMLGLHLSTWDAFCNLCMMLSMLTGLGGGILTMYLGMEQTVVLAGLSSGIIGNGIILLFDCLYGISNMRALLRADMMDYLENTYKPRLENETFRPGMMEEYRQEYFEEPIEKMDRQGKVVHLKGRETNRMPDYKVEFTKEEEEVIREVIREYMG